MNSKYKTYQQTGKEYAKYFIKISFKYENPAFSETIIPEFSTFEW